MKKVNALIISCLLGVFSTAHATETNLDGYLVDSKGHVVKTSSGFCVKTDSYSPSVTYSPECDTPVNKPYEVVEAKPALPVVSKPQPVVAPVVATFSAETLFAFDSDKLTQAGQRLVGMFMKNYNESNVSEVVIKGYTDPIGSEAYNLKLSERRAHAVQAFIALNSSIPSSMIHTHALGSQDLKTTNCGVEKTAKNIRCHTPNRRVEIEITTK